MGFALVRAALGHAAMMRAAPMRADRLRGCGRWLALVMLPTLALLLALLPALSGAAPVTPARPPIERRDASADETASFDAFFRDRLAAGRPAGIALAPGFAPYGALDFDIQRRRGAGSRGGKDGDKSDGSAWEVVARVDMRSRHAAAGLCQVQRASFLHDPANGAWREYGSADTLAWLSAGPAIPCVTPAPAVPHPVQLAQAVSPADAIALLQQQATLLQRARLLFAGNTECVRLRALSFTLQGIEARPPADGGTMFALVWHSDRNNIASVVVRKHRGEYAAWNVSCPDR